MSKEKCFSCQRDIDTDALNADWVLDGEQEMKPIHSNCLADWESTLLETFDHDDEENNGDLIEPGDEEDDDYESDQS